MKHTVQLILFLILSEMICAQNDTITICGHVLDAGDNHPVFASVSTIDKKNDSLIAKSYTDSLTGRFCITMPVNANYVFLTEAAGYIVSFSDKNSLNAIRLKRIVLNDDYRFSFIFFGFNSSEIDSSQMATLDSNITILTSFMQKYPEHDFLICGYSDLNEAEGTGMQRAKAVYECLIKSDIPENKLTCTDSHENYFPDNEKLNRRVEIVIKKN